MQNLNIAYFGAPDFAARLLDRIVRDQSPPVRVPLVVTQPNRPVGRKKLMTPTPVKEMAVNHGIRVYDTPLRSNCEISRIITESQIDLILLFAFGEIIRKDLLDAPRYGIWNVHPSLLPRYRGASPIVYPILLGDQETGVTLMQMDEELDHGPVLKQSRTPIGPHDSHEDLETRLTEEAFRLFNDSVRELAAGKPPKATIQAHGQATYTRTLQKNDGFIPFTALKQALRGETTFRPEIVKQFVDKNPGVSIPELNSGRAVYAMYRALHGWPGIWTLIPVQGSEKRLKITECGYDSRLQIKRVQLEGKNEVDFKTFHAAYKIF